MATQRLQKILAHAGIASRRAAEELMRDGRVTVNGQIVDRLGTQADPDRDHIKVDGRRIKPATGQHVYFLAFKPREMITTLSDPEGRPTILDLLKAHGVRGRVYPVGRLDWDADGLLLLTDDGELAHRVMHPRLHLPKVYRLRVKGNPNERDLDRVRRGIVLEPGVRTLPAEVRVEAEEESGTRLRVTLVEGRQNQIKRMFERIGHPVRRLRRIQIGPLRLGTMKPGELRMLSGRELDLLRGALDGTIPVRTGPVPRPVAGSRRGAAQVAPIGPRASRAGAHDTRRAQSPPRGRKRSGGASGSPRKPRGTA